MPSDSSAPPTSPTKHKSRLKWLIVQLIKITIAVLGLWLVTRMVTWNDAATIPANAQLRNITFTEDTVVTVLGQSTLPAPQFGPAAAQPRVIVRIRFPDKPVALLIDGKPFTVVIDEHTPIPAAAGGGQLNLPHELDVPLNILLPIQGERVRAGFHSILINASSRWYLLLAAWAILVIPYLVTAVRWRNLLRPQGINMPFSTCLKLTFVGQFYSIMLPGITGGDLVKIVYTAKLTGSKTKSLITILLDRVIGLLALMVIGAVSAGIQLLLNERAGLPLDKTLLRVFFLILAILAGISVAALVYFSRRLRKFVGIELFMDTFASTADPDATHHRHDKLETLFRAFNLLLLIISILLGAAAAIIRWETHGALAKNDPILLVIIVVLMALTTLAALLGLLFHTRAVDKLMPLFIKAVAAIIRVDDVLHTYRGHFGVLASAFLISIPSQLMLPLSAWLSGMAFGMNLNVGYYLAYVPVVTLATSIPASPPQGVGVLDYIVVHFFAERGAATAGQAFALAQSIRFLPILWNLIGGFWVITGTYSRHQAQEESRQLDAEPSNL